ncbi:MAG: YbaB/EbfC family nucleoid-associated protein [Spiroplasma sp.]|nr:YbaB/EbfC family nucleoid-associated protein [Spiroplasma sp.]
MNNFQQMLNQAKMVQRKHEQFKKELFEFSEQGDLIKISVSGSYQIELKINFQELVKIVENDYAMLNDMIQVAINKAISEVKKRENKLINVM